MITTGLSGPHITLPPPYPCQGYPQLRFGMAMAGLLCNSIRGACVATGARLYAGHSEVPTGLVEPRVHRVHALRPDMLTIACLSTGSQYHGAKLSGEADCLRYDRPRWPCHKLTKTATEISLIRSERAHSETSLE